jgi:hypothetical protein
MLAKQKQYIEAKKFIKKALKLKQDCAACRKLSKQIESAIKEQRHSKMPTSRRNRRNN